VAKNFVLSLEKPASWCELCSTREQAVVDGTPGTKTLWYGLIDSDGRGHRKGLSLCPEHRVLFAAALIGAAKEEKS
jgi:hypothetical protein